MKKMKKGQLASGRPRDPLPSMPDNSGFWLVHVLVHTSLNSQPNGCSLACDSPSLVMHACRRSWNRICKLERLKRFELLSRNNNDEQCGTLSWRVRLRRWRCPSTYHLL